LCQSEHHPVWRRVAIALLSMPGNRLPVQRWLPLF
jgi:hypothetical protein